MHENCSLAYRTMFGERNDKACENGDQDQQDRDVGEQIQDGAHARDPRLHVTQWIWDGMGRGMGHGRGTESGGEM